MGKRLDIWGKEKTMKKRSTMTQVILLFMVFPFRAELQAVEQKCTQTLGSVIHSLETIAENWGKATIRLENIQKRLDKLEGKQ